MNKNKNKKKIKNKNNKYKWQQKMIKLSTIMKVIIILMKFNSFSK